MSTNYWIPVAYVPDPTAPRAVFLQNDGNTFVVEATGWLTQREVKADHDGDPYDDQPAIPEQRIVAARWDSETGEIQPVDLIESAWFWLGPDEPLAVTDQEIQDELTQRENRRQALRERTK